MYSIIILSLVNTKKRTPQGLDRVRGSMLSKSLYSNKILCRCLSRNDANLINYFGSATRLVEIFLFKRIQGSGKSPPLYAQSTGITNFYREFNPYQKW